MPEPTVSDLAFKVLVWTLRLLLGLGIVFGGATARVLWSGEREVAASTAGLLAGDPREASVHARRAASWYAPGAPHVRVAYERLKALATQAERVGDKEEALFAWRGVRSASLGSRWLLTPHAEDLKLANRAIARLEAEAPRPPNLREQPPAQLERAALAELERDEAPRAGWVLVLLSGFGLWSTGLVWALKRSVERDSSPLRRLHLPAIGLVGLGVGLWVMALLQA